jgi:L-fucose mutarotase/ribose pyranase (RbsD/FucU family)
MTQDAIAGKESWESRWRDLLPLLGHRNWVVIADSAYPAQSSPGIETLVTGASHMQVLEKVLRALASSAHVRAGVYLDAELKHVGEKEAPGVDKIRDEIARQLEGQHVSVLAHEQILAKLDTSSRLFRAVVFKSTLTIPYTSVFLELECGYWSRDAEKQLRSRMRRSSKP